MRNTYRDTAVIDMSYEEFKDSCHTAWDGDFNYLYIDRSKQKDEEKHNICNESKNAYIESIPETQLF